MKVTHTPVFLYNMVSMVIVTTMCKVWVNLTGKNGRKTSVIKDTLWIFVLSDINSNHNASRPYLFNVICPNLHTALS